MASISITGSSNNSNLVLSSTNSNINEDGSDGSDTTAIANLVNSVTDLSNTTSAIANLVNAKISPFDGYYLYDTSFVSPVGQTIAVAGKIYIGLNDAVYLDICNQVVHLLNPVESDVNRTLTTSGSTKMKLQAGYWDGGQILMRGTYDQFVSTEFKFVDGKLNVSLIIDGNIWPAFPATLTFIATKTNAFNLKNKTPPEGQLVSPPAPPSTPPAKRDNKLIKFGPSGFPLCNHINSIFGIHPTSAMAWFASQTGCDVFELWNSQINSLSQSGENSIDGINKACLDFNVQCIGMLSDIDSFSRDEEVTGAYGTPISSGGNLTTLGLGNSDSDTRKNTIAVIIKEFPVYKKLGLKYVRYNVNSNLTDSTLALRNEIRANVIDSLQQICDELLRQQMDMMVVIENHSNISFSADNLIKIVVGVNRPNCGILIDNNNWDSVNLDGTRGPYNVIPEDEYLKALPYTYVLCGKCLGSLNPLGQPFILKSLNEETTTSLFNWKKVFRAWADILTGKTPTKLSRPPLPYILIESEYNMGAVNVSDRIIDYKNCIDFLRSEMTSVVSETEVYNPSTTTYKLNLTPDEAYQIDVIKENTELAQRNYELLTQERMRSRSARTLANIKAGDNTYAAIVVGSGPSGCAAAVELAKNLQDPTSEFYDTRPGNIAWTQKKAKKVLLIERGPSRPISYIGGENYYGFGGNVNAENRIFGKRFQKDKPYAPQLQTVVPYKTGGYELQVDASGIAKFPYQLDLSSATNDFSPTIKESGSGNNPAVFGGGSTYNGAAMQLAPAWWLEQTAALGNCPLDMTKLSTLAYYYGARFDKDGEGSLLRNDKYFNDVVLKDFAENTPELNKSWIGTASGEDLENYLRVNAENPNSGYGIAEHGGVRNRCNNLRLAKNGYVQRHAAAQLVEDYANESNNLDILFETLVDEIEWDTSGAKPRAKGIKVKVGADLNDPEGTGEELTINLDLSGGFLMLAGNVYNTPALLERSGVGRADVLASVDISLVAQNDYIGDYFRNNLYVRHLPTGFWSADKYWGPEALKSVYTSSLDLRGPNGYNTSPGVDINYHSHNTSESSSFRVEGTIASATSSEDTRYQAGWWQGAFNTLQALGQIHISNEQAPNNTYYSKYKPKSHMGWFSNPELDVPSVAGGRGSPNNNTLSNRTKEAIFQGMLRMYDMISGRNSRMPDKVINGVIYKQYATATHAVGKGFDASGNPIHQSAVCKIASAEFRSKIGENTIVNFPEDSSKYLADPVTGVYVRTIAGYPLRKTVLEPYCWEENRDSFIAVAQARNGYKTKGNYGSFCAYDSIHWIGGCAVGKALDKDWKVKGVNGVYVCDSASHCVTYPFNNWGINAQMGAYVAHHALGLTNPIKLAGSIQATKIQNLLDSSNASISKTGTTVTPVAIIGSSNDMHFTITRGNKTTPTIPAKLVNIRGDVYSYRCVRDMESGDISITSHYPGAHEVGIRDCLLQLKYNSVSNMFDIVKLEVAVSSYTATDQVNKITGNSFLNSGLNKIF